MSKQICPQESLFLNDIEKSPLSMSIYFPCLHNSIKQFDSFQNCKDCGIYINTETNIYSYKTKKNSYNSFFNSKNFIDHLYKKSQLKTQKKSSAYLKNRNSLIDWIMDTSQKLSLSLNTAHLSITYLDFIMNSDPLLYSQMQLFSATCILLAAKAIELDERIPFIPKLKKYAAPVYQIQDFKACEQKILTLLDWDLQLTTNLDIMEYYLSQGIIFSNDEINGCFIKVKRNIEHSTSNYLIDFGDSPNSDSNIEQKFASPFTNKNFDNQLNDKKLYEMIGYIERDILKLVGLVVKDYEFKEMNQKILGASMIAFIRKINKILPIWNEEFVKISGGVTYNEIEKIIDLLIFKFGYNFNYNASLKNLDNNGFKNSGNISMNNLTENMSKISLKSAFSNDIERIRQEDITQINRNDIKRNSLNIFSSNFERNYNTNLNNFSINTNYKNLSINHMNNLRYPLIPANSFRLNDETNFAPTPNILKDAENKLNISKNIRITLPNNKFDNKNNTSLTISQLSKKIDDVYERIFFPQTKISIPENNLKENNKILTDF